MRIASPSRTAGRVRQNAARRVILSGDTPARGRSCVKNMPTHSVVSAFFQIPRGVFLALVAAQNMSVSSQMEVVS